MDREAVIVFNWIFGPLLLLATIILIWKMVSERVKGERLSFDLINMCLILGLAVIGIIQLNSEVSPGWLQWVLLVIQLLTTVFLWKRLWSPLMQKLRG